MKANRINLNKYTAESRKLPNDLFGYALKHDEDPEFIKSWPIEHKDDALAELAKYRNSAERREGHVGSFYYITAYALDFFEADDEGEFIEGSDYEVAKDAFDQIKYISEYNKSMYDRIEIKVPKGTKAEWQAKAKKEGMSLTEWIVAKIAAQI